MGEEQELWVTVSEAAELLGRHERTIRRWEKTGKIPSDRTGPVLRVDIAGVVPYNAGTAPGATGAPPVQGEVVTEADLLRAENEQLRESLEDLREVVHDLRRQRDFLQQALTESQQNLALSQAIAQALTPQQPQLTDGTHTRRWWEFWQRD